MRKILLALLLTAVSINPVFADFKYKEEIKTETQMPGMFQGFMQNNPANRSEVKTVYIKGSKLRVDYNSKKISIITRCDKRQIIALDHNKKLYNIKSIDEDLKEIKGLCSGIAEAGKEMKKAQTAKSSKAPLTFKTVITDTKLNETIGSYKTRKYIRESIISGNPSCMPNMQTKEYVWTAPLKSECFSCPVYASFKGCKSAFMPGKIPDCFKNAKHVKAGLSEIPGFIIRTQTTVDMSKMMGNMQGMETGRASAIDIINSGFDIFGRAVDAKRQVNEFAAPQDNEDNQNYQQNNQYYPQQNYNQYQPQQNYYNQPDNADQQDIQMNPNNFKMTSTTTMTRTNISYNALPESLFEVPQGYKLSKSINPSDFQGESGIYESTCNSSK